MIYNPGHTEYFRKSTDVVTKQAGITQIRRLCCKCGKPGIGLVKIKGTGSSRHNPAQWKHREC